MSETTRELPAQLTLFGHSPAPAMLRAEPRSGPGRRARALIALLVCWALVPIVAIVPPHIPWALAAFIAGIYLARKNWRGTHLVHELEGACPRCETPVRMRRNTLIRLPHALTCYGCQSELILSSR